MSASTYTQSIHCLLNGATFPNNLVSLHMAFESIQSDSFSLCKHTAVNNVLC